MRSSVVVCAALLGAFFANVHAGPPQGFAGPPAPVDPSDNDFDDQQQPIPRQNDDYNSNRGRGGYGRPNGGYGRPYQPPVVENPSGGYGRPENVLPPPVDTGYQRPNGGYGRPDDVQPPVDTGYQRPTGGYGRPENVPPPVDTGYQRPTGGYGRPNGGYGRPDIPTPPIYDGDSGARVPYNPNGHYAGPYGVPNYG